MRVNTVHSLIAATLVLLLPPAGVAAQARELTGTTWRLVSYGDVDKPNLVKSGAGPRGHSIPTIKFKPDGRLEVHVDCNRAETWYQIQGDKLTVGPEPHWQSEAMLCRQDSSEQTTKVARGLTTAERFLRAGQWLMIYYDAGKNMLLFEALHGR